MNKRRISIIGSCVSRNLFSTSTLHSLFDIDCYAFQRCIWDALGDSFCIPKESFDKIPSPEFSVRMLEYSLNKSMIPHLTSIKSEYLFVDMHNLTAPLFSVTLGDKCVYMQNTTGDDIRTLNNAKNLGISPFDKMIIEEIETPDYDKIERGLKKFAEWASENYDETKIIIYAAKFAKRYFHGGLLKDFSTTKQEMNLEKQQLSEKYSLYLKSLFPKAVYLPDVGRKTACYGTYDDMELLYFPPAEHYSPADHLRQADLLIGMLDLQLDKADPYYDECLRLHAQLAETSFYASKLKRNLVTLNNYFDKFESLNDFIVVITASDEASRYLKYFRNKQAIGISAVLGFRDSYIAIIDKSRNFLYEKASQEKLIYEYAVDGKSIKAVSGGFNAGNESSVSVVGVEGATDNFSKGKRGFNIVVLDCRTLECIDCAYCDTFGDKDLTVHSEALSNFKIKSKRN